MRAGIVQPTTLLGLQKPSCHSNDLSGNIKAGVSSSNVPFMDDWMVEGSGYLKFLLFMVSGQHCQMLGAPSLVSLRDKLMHQEKMVLWFLGIVQISMENVSCEGVSAAMHGWGEGGWHLECMCCFLSSTYYNKNQCWPPLNEMRWPEGGTWEKYNV